MTFLSWTANYRIGNATIDSEHQELFRLINEFHSRWTESRERRDIAVVLNKLVRYSQQHFTHEEAIMAAAGYHKLDDHRAIHVQLFETIFELHEKFANHDMKLELETMKFVKAWLVEHILHDDYEFRDFLARGAREQQPRPDTP